MITAQLTGADLDYWAAKVAGVDTNISPSTNEKDAGPLLDQFLIGVIPSLNQDGNLRYWVGYCYKHPPALVFGWIGSTRLEAGMRALVAYAYNTEVPSE